MKRLFLLCFLCLMCPLIAQGDNGRAFQLADLYSVQYPGSLTVAGETGVLLFTLSSSDLKAGTTNTDVWRLVRRTGAIQQLTADPASDSSPFASPDGKWIYFVSTRKDGAQLWRMPTDGGEGTCLTSFSTGISNPIPHPDGRHVYFVSDVFPECGADSECNRTYQERLAEGPAKGHHATSLLFRHWNHYRDWTYSHVFELDLNTGTITALTDGKNDFPCYGGSLKLSPDGMELCVTVNMDVDKAESTNSDLMLINLRTGARRIITRSNPAYDGDPVYSPDGRYIAYRYQRIPGYESDRFRLAVYDRHNATTTFLTESVDNWVQEFNWLPDNSGIYFAVPDKGYTTLHKVAMGDGSITEVLKGHYISSFVVADDGTLFFTRSAVGEPYEIWQFTPGKDSQPVAVTSFNKELVATVDIRPAEIMWFEGANGKQIQTFVVKPHNFDPSKRYPLILNVHGGPQMMWADSFRGDWQVYPGAGYIVAYPNPHGSTGYGQDFTAAISRDYDGKVMEDINAVAEGLAALPYVDGEHMGAMGWSWGGYAMMWLEGHNKHFKALVSMMGIFDLESMYLATEELWFPDWDNGGAPWENRAYYNRATPSNYVENFKTPCLVITGERDYRVPYTQSLQFFTALQKTGVESELIVFSNDGHWPDTVKSMPIYYNAHLEWFHRFLGGDPAPYRTVDMLRNIAFDTIN